MHVPENILMVVPAGTMGYFMSDSKRGEQGELETLTYLDSITCHNPAPSITKVHLIISTLAYEPNSSIIKHLHYSILAKSLIVFALKCWINQLKSAHYNWFLLYGTRLKFYSSFRLTNTQQLNSLVNTQVEFEFNILKIYYLVEVCWLKFLMRPMLLFKGKDGRCCLDLTGHVGKLFSYFVTV